MRGPPTGTSRPFAPRSPLEPTALAEVTDQTDLALAVELGQVFERALRDLDRPALVDRFRDSYALVPDDAPAPDADAQQFLKFATGRATHGIRLFLAAERALPGLPAEPALNPGDEDVVREALNRLRSWWARRWGISAAPTPTRGSPTALSTA